MEVKIGDIIPVSTIDWKGHCAMVIFMAGCPFNCVYCSNSQFINGGEYVSLDKIKKKIDEARPVIDAVVLSGGEPFMQPKAVEAIGQYCYDSVIEFGVHTNGVFSDLLLSRCDLFGGVMIDVKAPLNSAAYPKVVGCGDSINGTFYQPHIENTIAQSMLLRREGIIKYLEFRTVVFKGINDKPKDLVAIYGGLPTADAYVVVQGNAKISRTPQQELPLREVRKLAVDLCYNPAWAVLGRNSDNIYVRGRQGSEHIK